VSIRAPLFLLALFVLVACSSTATGSSPGTGSDPNAPGGGTTPPASSEFDALFQPPNPSAKVTGNSLFGLWAETGSGSSQDIRLKISDVSFTRAVRCDEGSQGTETVGVTATARVSNSSIELLETKSAVSASKSCGVGVKVSQLTSCIGSSTYDCFELSGTQLTAYFDYPQTFLKLSD
jgi:hypothetical protein